MHVDDEVPEDGKKPVDAHAKLHRDVRRTFNLIVEDALAKR